MRTVQYFQLQHLKSRYVRSADFGVDVLRYLGHAFSPDNTETGLGIDMEEITVDVSDSNYAWRIPRAVLFEQNFSCMTSLCKMDFLRPRKSGKERLPLRLSLASEAYSKQMASVSLVSEPAFTCFHRPLEDSRSN